MVPVATAVLGAENWRAHMGQADKKLRDGIMAFKHRHRARSRQLLKEAVQLDPANWKAWLWLSRVAETQEERRACLQKTLELKPETQIAKRELAELDPVPKSTEAMADKPSDDIPHQPVDILGEMLREQRKQAATLQKLLKEHGHLVSSVHAIESAARLWTILVALGILLVCIGVLVGNPFGF